MFDQKVPKLFKNVSTPSKNKKSDRSVEDDLIHENIKLKQELKNPLLEESAFKIVIKPVKNFNIKENYIFTRTSPPRSKLASQNKLTRNCSSLSTAANISNLQKDSQSLKNDSWLSFSKFDLGTNNFSFEFPSDLLILPKIGNILSVNNKSALNIVSDVLDALKKRHITHCFNTIKLESQIEAFSTKNLTSNSSSVKVSGLLSNKQEFHKKWLKSKRGLQCHQIEIDKLYSCGQGKRRLTFA